LVATAERTLGGEGGALKVGGGPHAGPGKKKSTGGGGRQYIRGSQSITESPRGGGEKRKRYFAQAIHLALANKKKNCIREKNGAPRLWGGKVNGNLVLKSLPGSPYQKKLKKAGEVKGPKKL